MKRSLTIVAVVVVATLLLAACGKECVCKTTRVTSTTHDERTDEMGTMSEDDCLKYNGTVNDGEGVIRTIDCHLN